MVRRLRRTLVDDHGVNRRHIALWGIGDRTVQECEPLENPL
ncbi:hypothetical protein HMPREF9622_02569 [Cutibacterium modestum HL037PA3]|uniref:Uncharacterized protein n=1 Tax=Cutibacterium modestum HL044PA1 TaxID=765109 RepID=A0ABN0C5H9_9ACTN|nr:hypothetical protein HMPREF9607_01285 [Cutibacterium modestum HL044PA1]EFT14415.1 hypothetical protein HMPREF9622_02569 [Cutibacterium modestum HL037PA3]EGG27889.1 hypothetical protein PA08_0116 [Cutibacterium modestum P08]